jgi:ERCC4-type nuclease
MTLQEDPCPRPSQTLDIVLDTNERGISAEAAAQGHQVQIRRLPVGDVAFYRGDELVALAERKTLMDLDSSILDGRFREQRERLRNLSLCDGGPLCFYIVEGCRCSAAYHSAGASKRVDGALENLSLIHNMHIVWTQTIKDTLDTLRRLAIKLNEPGSSRGYAGPLKSRGAALSEDIFTNMLTVIPGVSLTVASAISKSYPSWAALSVAWSASKSPETLLSGLAVNQKRKVGPSVSKKVYATFHATKNTSTTSHDT